LERAFYGFEPDFFQQNVSRMVDDVISQIKGSLELWPTLVEIVYLHKDRAALPKVLIRNHRKSSDARDANEAKPTSARAKKAMKQRLNVVAAVGND
jgi:hypothetical protein